MSKGDNSAKPLHLSHAEATLRVDCAELYMKVLTRLELAVHFFRAGDWSNCANILLNTEVLAENDFLWPDNSWEIRYQESVSRILSETRTASGRPEQDVHRPWVVANILFRSGTDWDRAHNEFLQHASDHPNDCLARYSVADLFITKCGWADLAYEHANAAVTIAPEFALGYVARGKSIAEMECEWGGDVGAKRPKESEAVADFDTALKISPSLVDAWHCKGLVLYSMGDLLGAKVAFERGREFAASCPEFWTLWIEIVDNRIKSSFPLPNA